MANKKFSKKFLSIVGGVFTLLVIVSVVWAAMYVSKQMASRDSVAPNAADESLAGNDTCGSSKRTCVSQTKSGCDKLDGNYRSCRNSNGVLGTCCAPKGSTKCTEDQSCKPTNGTCCSGKSYRVVSGCTSGYKCGTEAKGSPKPTPQKGSPKPTPQNGGTCSGSYSSCGSPSLVAGSCVKTCVPSSGGTCWVYADGCVEPTVKQSACGLNYNTSIYLDCGSQCCTKATQICTYTGCQPK